MLLSIQPVPTSLIDVLLVWKCFSCREVVQAVCDVDAATVPCPECGAEKRRFTEPKK